MQLVFNPPIGDAVHVTTSHLLHTTPLIFTATIALKDYDQLVRDGGRVQLWSDLPRDGQPGGEWSESDFVERVQVSHESEDAYIISLSGSIPVFNEKEITLDLPISLHAADSRTRRFSFTYRIAYASGDIKWLGAYGKNGSLVVKQGDIKSFFDGIVLNNGWSVDASQRARVFEAKDADGLEVIRVNKPSNFRMWALGKESFLSNMSNAAVIFAVPRLQPHGSLKLHPTYVLAASPGLSLSVVSGGQIIASGSGTAILQTHQMHTDIQSFIQQNLNHGSLDGWNVLAGDLSSKSVVLASPRGRHPISAAVIPLWSSEHTSAPLRVGLDKMVDAFSSTDLVKEFSLFSSYNLQMHIFTKTANWSRDLLLQSDSTHGEFTLSPILKLRAAGTPRGIRRTWAAAILSPYSIVPPPYGTGDLLPTPPPSPHLHPINRLSLPSISSVASAISSVDTLALDNSPKDDERVDESPPTRPSRSPTPLPVIRRSPSPPRPRSLVQFLLRTIFASFTIFVRFFFRIFWSRLPMPRRFSGLQTLTPLDENQGQRSRNDSSASTPQDEVPAPIIPDLPTVIVDGTDTDTLEDDATQNPDHGSSTSPVELGDNSSNAQNEAGSGPGGQSSAVSSGLPADDLIYAELRCNVDDMTSRRTTAAVALFPVDHENVDLDDEESVIEVDATAQSQGPNVQMEGAVRFLDGSEAECALSKCDAVVHGSSTHTGGSLEVVKDTCYLLEYQIDWEEVQKARVVSISTPVSVA